MPWKEKTVEMEREEFVKRVLSKEKSKSELCREYGISRPTGDKWIARCMNGNSLENKSRAPFHTANKTDSQIEEQLLKYRHEHPAIGAVKIKRILENKGITDLPSTSTVNAIFKRNGCITRQASLAATPYQRFEKENPNDMWQADFKGHFLMENGLRCHPLNIIDDHSRYNLCSDAMLTETFKEVYPSMTRLFNTFGLPFSLLCDNGNPWGTVQSTGYSKFEVWLMELGILTLHGRIRHPQTQGKEESFNRSMTRELLKLTEFTDLSDAQKKFDEYREFYNNERPHFALNLDVPASHYAPSARCMPSVIKPWEYSSEYKLHKVKSSGYIAYNGQGYFLSEAFGDKTIGIRESHIDGQISLFFRQFRIGRIDIEKRVFTLKRAYLINNDPRL